MEHVQPPDFLRAKTICKYYDFSRSTLYKLSETDPDFPRKIILSPRCVGWLKTEIDAYLLGKSEAASHLNTMGRRS